MTEKAAGFRPMSTATASFDEATKTLLIAHHGWGKTFQCRNYQKEFGRGFVISGESGLMSLRGSDIDYLPFKSWNGPEDHDNGIYSFRGILRLMGTPEFKAQGYKWICIDSLTELADRCFEWAVKENEFDKNGFKKYEDYKRQMLGCLKMIRDLPVHVLMTALASARPNEMGLTEYWPLVQGKNLDTQLPGMFDHVFCGVKKQDGSGDEKTVSRYVITDEVDGWHGKTRDPSGALKAIEQEDNIAKLLTRMMKGAKA